MSDCRSLSIDVRDLSVDRMGGRLREPAGNARAHFAERLGLVVRVRDAGGVVGLGEASPLPGHSPDTLEACEHELSALACELEGAVALADIPDVCARLHAPAARFALETALFDVMARRARVSVAELLAHVSGRSVRPWVPSCALLDPLSPAGAGAGADDDGVAFDAALAHVRAAFQRGMRCIKVKIGRAGTWPRERALLRAIRGQLGPSLALRLDVNGAWSAAEARENLAQLAEFEPDYVEDPCAEVSALAPAPVPLAVDQPLAAMSDADIDELLANASIAALVLKPMVLGGALRCLELAARAESHGVRAIISHLLDGPIACSAYAGLALLLNGTPGLDRHVGLSAWPALSLPHVGGARVRYSGRHGLGLSEPALFAAGDHLSVSRRARIQPPVTALITAERALTYDELLAGVDQLDLEPSAELPGLLPIVAARTVDTVLRLLYALEQRMPAVLLPARAGEREHARLLALCHSLAREPGARAGHDSATLALVLFTSGSRGRSKGVLISRAALIASAHASAENLGWRDDDRWLCALPLAHIGGLSIITRSLLAGRPFVLAPEGRFDPAGLIALMERTRVTLASFVPTMLSRLLDIDWSPPAHLRAVLLGGAPAPDALLERAHARGVPVLTTYGMTETCAQICTRSYAGAAREPLVAGRVGSPLPGVELEIRQERIFVRGDMLFSGYLGAATPIDQRGFFDTGDRGHLDADGCLWVRGRADETIITGGENVDPGEVEGALLEHPDIRAACVFGVEDATWGQIIAMVVTGERPLVAAELARFLGQRLPAGKRPRLWCQWAELATDASHKVQRARVAESARASLRPLSYPR